MNEQILGKQTTLDSLHPEWGAPLLPQIQSRLNSNGRKLVILDDGPTGTQTVYGVPVLTDWSVPTLMRELEGDSLGFYILTNSRSLVAEKLGDAA